VSVDDRRKVDPVTINVLITGCAGNQAHFIWSALKRSSLSLRIIGCNYDHLGAGLYRFDAGYVVPPARDPRYVAEIARLCRNEDVRIIMAGNMAEMRALAANKDRIYEQTGAFVVTSPPDVLLRTEDKLAAARYLAQRGFDSPRSVSPDDRKEMQRFLDEVAFPVIVKDRFGAGSKGVAPAHDRAELHRLLNSIPNPVIQEYLWPDDEEYTIGVFLSAKSVAVASIVMKRQLGLGMTWKARVLPESPLGAYCERILEGSGCVGPCNVQLRLTARGPVVFEINPRFSSTTSARSYFGYNEPEMCIRHFVLGESVPRPPIRGGWLFRVVEDVFVGEESVESLRSGGILMNDGLAATMATEVGKV
jgi:carbamoyl-phosphate synthase large subunit